MWRSLKELGQFLMERKKYWLIPVVVLLALVALMLVLAEGSAIGLLIYPLF